MIYFVGAGPGDPELITVKGQKILQQATAVLYTGSLIPKELLQWVSPHAVVESSANMNYNDIVLFLQTHAEATCVRLHTGDPSLYSTMAQQIAFLKEKKIPFQIIPGVTAAFAAAASLQVEYTIPALSQGVLLTRLDGKTHNPESLEKILSLKQTSLVFYLSATLCQLLLDTAKKMKIPLNTPVIVCYKVSWKDEKIFSTTLEDLPQLVVREKITGIALILMGDFLRQDKILPSHLYSDSYKSARKTNHE